ncbi:MAG: hypothetical protein WBX22_01530 [Silvibacterium sp.]
MPATTHPSREDLKTATARALEWKTFRRDFLYSQKHLAHALRCSRRTVVAVEGAEVLSPNIELLRRFRDLKRRQQMVNGSSADTNASLLQKGA